MRTMQNFDHVWYSYCVCAAPKSYVLWYLGMVIFYQYIYVILLVSYIRKSIQRLHLSRLAILVG